MEDLCPRRVWGFSTGCILAPRRWTLDVASHHLPHIHPNGGADFTKSALRKGEAIKDALPLGTSSNTARFESMDATGATLYVTELFVPHASHPDLYGAPGSEHSDGSTLFTERLRASLLRQPSWRAYRAVACDSIVVPDATGASGSGCVERECAPLRVWVIEVTPLHSSFSSGTVTSRVDPAATTSCSIAGALEPFFRLFLEVVWDGGASASVVSGTVEDALHLIVEHLQKLYLTPTLELDRFFCFTAGGAANGALPGESRRVSPQSANLFSATFAATQLREPCAPHALAHMGDETLSPAFGTALYSAAGAAFFQLLLPPLSVPPQQQQQQQQHSGIFAGQRGSLSWIFYPGSAAPEVGDGGSTSTPQHLLQHDLQLCWEGLVLSTRVAEVETVVAVAALPLDVAGVAASSIYSFPSVEQAWEAHVRCVLSQRQRQECSRELAEGTGKVSSASVLHGTVLEWDLRRLSTSSRPVAEQLEAMLHKAELHQLVLDDPSLSDSERCMRLVARDVGAPLVSPRCTSYSLRLRRRAADVEQPCSNDFDGIADKTSRAGSTNAGTETEDLYVLQLHAPRVLSRHALVVCMSVPTSLVMRGSCPGTCHVEQDNYTTDAYTEDRVALAAAALQSVYRIAPHVPSLWLPRGVVPRESSGVCSRSGRLLLHVPALTTRYADLHLMPVASNAFTTLGSIVAWTALKSLQCSEDDAGQEGSALIRGTSSLASSIPTLLANMSAVWTLIGDGRNAAAYLEDMLSEYMYESGAKSLFNVSQPSQHEHQPGRLVVRRRPKQQCSAAGTSAVPSKTCGVTPPSVAVQEVCSAWLDLGATNRLFLSVRDVGVGEVLLVKASLVGPHTEIPRSPQERCDAVTSAREATSRAEEMVLEDWIAGITAGTVAPQRH